MLTVKYTRGQILVGLALVILSNSLTGPVHAQSDTNSSLMLEEILVTAQKRTESLQDTPISMQVVSGLELLARTSSDVSQIAEFTPNLEFDATSPISGSSNAAVIFIRGIGQTDFVLTSDPGVGIYLDGVYIARAMGGVLDLMDIAQVEILRGPQGTLFGKNTVGGAISVSTKKPTAEPEFDAGITVGDEGRLDGMLSFNYPITDDSLFFRGSLATRNRDGYGYRLLTGETMGSVNSDTFRGSLLWQASDNLEFTLAADVTSADEDLPATKLLKADPNIGGMNNLSGLYNLFSTVGWVDGPAYNDSWITDGDFESNGTAPVGSKTDVMGVSLTSQWDLSELSLKSITAYRETETSFGRDTDHSPITILHTANEMDLEQFSQEFNISGQAFASRLDWLVGAYYFSEQGNDIVDVALIPDVFAADSAFASGPGNGNGYLGVPLPEFSVHGDIEIDNTSVALYFHNTFAITDRLSTTFGVRYTEEEKKTVLDIIQPTTGERLVQNQNADQDFDDLSPRIGLEYSWSDDIFSYVSYSEGFKSGGVVSRYVAPREDPIIFEPEEVKSYEIGLKSELFGRRLRLNAAAFFTDYTNIQVTVFNGIVPETRNAAEGEIAGVELDFTALLTDKLVLSGGVGYMDAKFTMLDDSIDGALEVSLEHKFVNTPELSTNLSLEYTIPVSRVGDLELRADYSYRDEIANDAVNTPELLEGSLELWNARAAFMSTSGHWEVAVFGRNLTDERYLSSGLSTTSFGIIEGIYGRPREYGLSVNYHY